MDYKIILIILMSMMGWARGMGKPYTQEQLKDIEVRYQKLKKERELEKQQPKPNQPALVMGDERSYTQDQKVLDQREYEQRFAELEKRLQEFEKELAIVPEKN